MPLLGINKPVGGFRHSLVHNGFKNTFKSMLPKSKTGVQAPYSGTDPATGRALAGSNNNSVESFSAVPSHPDSRPDYKKYQPENVFPNTPDQYNGPKNSIFPPANNSNSPPHHSRYDRGYHGGGGATSLNSNHSDLGEGEDAINAALAANAKPGSKEANPSYWAL